MQETCSKHSGLNAHSGGRRAPPQAARVPRWEEEVYTPWQQLGHPSWGQKAPNLS